VKPVATDDCNSLLKLPGGTEENDLPCRVENGWTHSTYEMDEAERAQVLEHEALVAWTWWGSMVGVRVQVGDSERVHTEVDMPVQHHFEEDGTSVWSYIAVLDEEELLEVRAGARIKLAVDMHPTCPVTVSVFTPATQEA
jgi:hypothetical protein